MTGALHSSVYRLVSVYDSRRVERVGMSFSESPLISQVMQNLLGSSVSTGHTLMATSLYFLPTKMASRVRMFCVSGAARQRCSAEQEWSIMMESESNSEWNRVKTILHRKRYATAMSSR